MPVDFWHTFVTDGLTSASLLIWEMEYGFCCMSHRIYLVADPEGEETHFFDPEGDSGGDCAAVCGKGSPHYYIMQPLMY